MKKTVIAFSLMALTALLSACGGGSGGGAVPASTPLAKVWANPANLNAHISVDGPDAWVPSTAMDRKGNAVVAWYQKDGALPTSHGAVYMSECRGGVWSYPASLADHISLAGQDAGFPHVAMGDNGDAIIVWHQSDGVDNRIYRSEYRNGKWKHPSGFSDCINIPGGINAQEPKVAMDNQGNTIIIWAMASPGFQLYKAEYRKGSWSLPSSLADHISPSGGEIAGEEQLAMDDHGNALISWVQYDGSHSHIYKSDLRGGTWIHPLNIGEHIDPSGEEASTPAVAVDNLDHAIIVWPQFDGATWQIFKSEYRGGKWIHPANLQDRTSIPGYKSAEPCVAMDDNGNAVLAWLQEAGSQFSVYRSDYRSGKWTSPTGIADHINPAGKSVRLPNTAMDNQGNAITAWIQSDGTNIQVYRSYYRDGKWINPADLTDHLSVAGSDAHDNAPPCIAMSEAGNILVVWSQMDGTTKQIYKSEYR